MIRELVIDDGSGVSLYLKGESNISIPFSDAWVYWLANEGNFFAG